MWYIEVPGVSQVEKGEQRRSYVYERCEVHWCCVAAAAAAVVTPLYRADDFEAQRICGLELSLVVFRVTRPHNSHTRAYKEAPPVAVTARKTLKYG